MKNKKSKILKKEVAHILRAFKCEYGITLKELRSIDHKPMHFYARQLFTRLVFDYYSYLAITRYIKLKSHSTIARYISNYENDIKHTASFIEMHQRITGYMECHKKVETKKNKTVIPNQLQK